jgi:hypothetical protein
MVRIQDEKKFSEKSTVLAKSTSASDFSFDNTIEDISSAEKSLVSPLN